MLSEVGIGLSASPAWIVDRIPIADLLTQCGWSLGVSSGFTSEGIAIFVADAHKNDGKRTISDEISKGLTSAKTGTAVC